MNRSRPPDGSSLPSLLSSSQGARPCARLEARSLCSFHSSFETAASRPPQDEDRNLLPCRQPALGGRYRQIAQVIAGDLFDRFADKRLDQQRLGLLLGEAARPQIKQQAFAARAGGRAMAACYIVGEDFQ